jgi:ribosomal protein L11 methyltransferase
VIVVVAATEDDVEGVQRHVTELGAGVLRVVAPSKTRRLVLADVDDERAAERLASTLRAEGTPAVSRPDGGVRLEAWMRDTRPLVFSEQLGVCFVWSEHDRSGPSTMIELEGGGFGSGTHATTRLLVEQLLARITGGERVLDVGCGSGVLALCALALGATNVVATDVAPAAIEATRRNAARNGMEREVQATLAPLGSIDETFDVVLANVGRAALVELAPELVARLSPAGWLGVSGFSPPQCEQVVGSLCPLVELERRTSGEWASLVLSCGLGATTAAKVLPAR